MKDKLFNYFKLLKFKLSLYDGIWSLPFAFMMFWVVGLLLSSIFGFAVGTYDMAFIQPLFLAIAVIIGASNASVLGLWFTFRGFFKYFYGYKDSESGKIINNSKIDFKELKSWVKLLLVLGVFFFFFSAVISVYIALI